MNAALQLNAYKQNQLNTTDSCTVLLMLYQGAIDALKRAAAYMEKGQMADKGREILLVNDIINQFLTSLDHKVGGEIAANLEGLYCFMLDELLLANAHNDAKRLATVTSLLSTLKSAWDEAIAAQRKTQAAGAAY